MRPTLTRPSPTILILLASPTRRSRGGLGHLNPGRLDNVAADRVRCASSGRNLKSATRHYPRKENLAPKIRA